MEYEHTFKAPQSCSIVILHKSSELVAAAAGGAALSKAVNLVFSQKPM